MACIRTPGLVQTPKGSRSWRPKRCPDIAEMKTTSTRTARAPFLAGGVRIPALSHLDATAMAIVM